VIEGGTQLTPSSLPISVTKGQIASSGLTRGSVVSSMSVAEAEAGGATAARGSLSQLPAGRGFKLDISRLDFQANKEEFERQFLISALRAFNGRINQTALHANIPKKTLLRKLEKYGINARDYS
jgi:DNA-binding NtrC family response regulator